MESTPPSHLQSWETSQPLESHIVQAGEPGGGVGWISTGAQLPQSLLSSSPEANWKMFLMPRGEWAFPWDRKTGMNNCKMCCSNIVSRGNQHHKAFLRWPSHLTKLELPWAQNPKDRVKSREHAFSGGMLWCQIQAPSLPKHWAARCGLNKSFKENSWGPSLARSYRPVFLIYVGVCLDHI